MKRLSTTDLAARDALCVRLAQTHTALDEALQTYIECVSTAWNDLHDAMQTYNTVVEETVEWMRTIAETLQCSYDERSERWQDSDAGQAYATWISEWKSTILEAVEWEEPAMPTLDVSDQGEILEALPEDV